MKKIIIHWTAGTNSPCSIDFEAYHYLIDKDGKVFKGKFSPEDNENCHDGKYAKHCGGGNTGSIGVSMCGMYGFKSRYDVGRFPISKTQCEALFKVVANLCKTYKIKVSPDTVMTHYEFGLKNLASQSAHKIDIVFLPPFPNLFPYEIGDFIRERIDVELSKIL